MAVHEHRWALESRDVRTKLRSKTGARVDQVDQVYGEDCSLATEAKPDGCGVVRLSRTPPDAGEVWKEGDDAARPN